MKIFFRLLSITAALRLFASTTIAETSATLIEELLRDPTSTEWHALSRFDGTLTRRQFETRLDQVFDPGHGLQPYLLLTDKEVSVFPTPVHKIQPFVVIRFAPDLAPKQPLPVLFRSPANFRRLPVPASGQPLAGLRVVIEPADIGGRWAKWEDRSVYFRDYGQINEGDLNLIVGLLLREKLMQLGASVFLVRDRADPVLSVSPEKLLSEAEAILRDKPALMPDIFGHQADGQTINDPRRLRIAAELLLTKTLETRARVALVRRSFQPDITIVLQHNATPESTDGHLTRINRNIFFVDGAYSPPELRDVEPRYRLLTKLLEDVTPIETEVAAAIACRFTAATGFPPVLYGDSADTRLMVQNNLYVVARNLAFNREHDGPVVVTEPYFMNQPDTLARLLAGDYAGTRIIAGKSQISIFHEYANCVVQGILDAYGH